MACLKENELYIVLGDDPDATLQGILFRDTVIADRYRWQFDAVRLYSRVFRNTLREQHAVVDATRKQLVSVSRHLTLRDGEIEDELRFRNFSAEKQSVRIALAFRPRFVDLFKLRDPADPGRVAERVSEAGIRESTYTSADGTTITASLDAPFLDKDGKATISLDPGESLQVTARLSVAQSGYDPTSFPALPDYQDWAGRFGAIESAASSRPGLRQAIDDLRMLQFRTDRGPYLSAGLPIFGNPFGRDAIIASLMLVDHAPEMLRTVLLFLADRQGKEDDPFREEEPGKILHEIRRGELSRTNAIPFGRYFGSVDSTPLFLMAVGGYLKATGDKAVVAALEANCRRALAWMQTYIGQDGGFATFESSGSGLTVQSWKDSPDSMVHADGSQAEQPIAVAEVQGYCYAALQAYASLPFVEAEEAAALRAQADALKVRFDDRYWLDDLGTYAMALDRHGDPLRVLSSDPGHLLWCGIVPEHRVRPLVDTLMSDAMWSGWGLRTLGSGEAAYNPVSYHNGSVWPHDTGLFGMGLARYGLMDECRIVADALLDLADSSPGGQIPELISGYGRDAFAEPVWYTHANAPQAWSAAALVKLATLVSREDG
ncbi:MAG: amylo-alpha-1,6-glucosidase [Litorimonas sp.]